MVVDRDVKNDDLLDKVNECPKRADEKYIVKSVVPACSLFVVIDN